MNRARGAALVASLVAMIVFVVLHPIFDDPRDVEGVFRAILGAGAGWRVAQTARIVAWMLILAAMMPSRSDGATTRVGYVWLVLGAAFVIAHSGFELALPLVLAPWADGGDDAATALIVATGHRNADAGMIAIGLVCSGAGLAALGVAIRGVRGWVQCGLGTLVTTSGLAFAVTGDFRAMAPAFVGSLALHVWLAVVGATWLAGRGGPDSD